MKDKIICLVGPSGSGKTTIAKELHDLGYNVIQSYTTRIPRWENEWGHIFINWFNDDGEVITGYDKDGNEVIRAEVGKYDELISVKDLYGDLYFATKEQYVGKGTSIYVVDPQGAAQVRKNIKDADVITIFLMCDERVRAYRLYKQRGYEETIKRLKCDREIFKTSKCDYVIDANRSLQDLVLDVIQIIKNENVKCTVTGMACSNCRPVCKNKRRF